MDNKELFTHKSEDYANFRPSYPDEALQFLRKKFRAFLPGVPCGEVTEEMSTQIYPGSFE